VSPSLFETTDIEDYLGVNIGPNVEHPWEKPSKTIKKSSNIAIQNGI
jgi:hypothetical protein